MRSRDRRRRTKNLNKHTSITDTKNQPPPSSPSALFLSTCLLFSYYPRSSHLFCFKHTRNNSVDPAARGCDAQKNDENKPRQLFEDERITTTFSYSSSPSVSFIAHVDIFVHVVLPRDDLNSSSSSSSSRCRGRECRSR